MEMCGRKLISAICISALFTILSASVNAALLPRLNGQAAYDTDLGITWITDTNLALTNSFGINSITTDPYSIYPLGSMTWYDANAYIAAMNNYDGSLGYLGINNWRLPSATIPDNTCSYTSEATGYNCTGSELGHLYYSEFGSSPSDLNSGDNNIINMFAPFPSGSAWYWTAEEATYGPIYFAYYFDMGWGSQGYDEKSINRLVIAVADGDVLPASTVPVPSALWLMLTGLLGLSAIGHNKTS